VLQRGENAGLWVQREIEKDLLHTRPESPDLDNVIFHAERIAATCWFVGGGARVMIMERRTTKALRSRFWKRK
jgi:hypothetical protein